MCIDNLDEQYWHENKAEHLAVYMEDSGKVGQIDRWMEEFLFCSVLIQLIILLVC